MGETQGRVDGDVPEAGAVGPEAFDDACAVVEDVDGGGIKDGRAVAITELSQRNEGARSLSQFLEHVGSASFRWESWD